MWRLSTTLILAMLAVMAVVPVHAGERAWLNVKDFGAMGDGKADDTVAIQKAIEASRKENMPVFFPRGRYRVRQPLTIEAQSLIGAVPGGWNADNSPIPQILVEHRSGPALTMKRGASVHGLAFMYLKKGEERFPPAILLSGGGLSLTNIRLQYPDDGIMADGENNIGRLNIENVFIVQPRGIGIYVTRTLDIPTLRNIEVWCNGPMQPGPAFKFGHNDDLRASHLFVFNVQVGFLFEEDPANGKGTWGTFTNCSTDSCSIGWRIEGKWHDLSIVGGIFWNHHTSLHLRSPGAKVRVTGAELQSNGAPAILSEACRSLIVTGCRFDRAFDNPDVIFADFRSVKALTFIGNQFSPYGPGVRIGPGVKQGIISGNIFEPSPYRHIMDERGDKSEIIIKDNLDRGEDRR
jgi:hypothetical protein